MSSPSLVPNDSVHDLVSFSILANGSDITPEVEVLAITVTHDLNRIPFARLVLRDGEASEEDFALSNERHFEPGAEIDIAVGYDANNQSIFKGIVIRHAVRVRAEGNSELTLECKDAAVRTTIGRKDHVFVDKKDSDALKQILQAYSGLSATVATTPEKHPELVQYHCSDWDFVLSRAEANGLLAVVYNGDLKIKAPATSGSAVGTLTYGVDLLEFEAEMDARTQLKATKASSWNQAKQQVAEKTGQEPSVNNQGNLTGKKLSDVIGLKAYELRHGGKVSDQELTAWADAQLLKSRLAKIQGRLHCFGSAAVKPDTLIELQGLGNRFNGLAYVSGVRHEIRDNNWLMWVQIGLAPDWLADRRDVMALPAGGLLPGINGLQIGKVTKIADDPDGEHRVQVKLPLIDPNGEGLWARVATLDAGKQRGTFFRPELDDEVVVGFLNDDPRDPIILGMLHSSKLAAPLTAEAANPEKGYFSREGLRLLFNDDKKSITVDTPGGHSLVMDDDAASIVIKDSNGNEVTLDSAGITLKSGKDITLDATGKLTLKAAQDLSAEGLNVSLAAQAQFKAEGSAGAEVSTSAIAVLKGSLVQIN